MSTNYRPETPISAKHVKHRETGRVFLYSKLGTLLMMHTRSDAETGLPPRWITPGGGIDFGESPKAAAKRELFEETGLDVTEDDLGELVYELPFEQTWTSGEFETGVAYFFELVVAEEFVPNNAGWMPDEHFDILEHKWWTTSELLASDALIGPPGLREYLSRRHAN